MYKDSNCRIIDGKLLYVVVFSSFFSLGLLAYRLFCNISFLEPLQLITSGCEESSLFSIWKYIHGYEVYGSPYKIPFAASYFNWLFYSFYGSVIKIAQKLFFLNDEWIPTVGRIITSIGCLCGITIVYKGLKPFSSYKDNATKFFYLSLAVYTFTGPLIGFWALTVRPDVWMLVFESLALVMFLNYFESNIIKASFFFFVCSYLSWFFKQSSVVVLIGVCFFLAINKYWKPFLIIISGSVFLWGITFLFQSKDYSYSLFIVPQYQLIFITGLKNLVKFIIKSFPTSLICLILSLMIIRSKEIRQIIKHNNSFQIIIVVLVVSFLFNFITSMKLGASDNYYFTTNVLSTFGTVIFLNLFARAKLPRNSIPTFWMLGWIINILVVASILMGLTGNLSNRAMNKYYYEVKRCVRKLPKPIFIEDTYANLPWINPSEYHFVVAFYYSIERNEGYLFERDGIGGLIKEGYFSSLLLRKSPSCIYYDRAPLQNSYKETTLDCNRFRVFLKK